MNEYLYDFLSVLSGNINSFRKTIRANLSCEKNIKVLDWGCGTGIFSTLFNHDGYHGIDVDEKRIRYAKKKYPEYNFEYVRDFNDHSYELYDMILFVGVLHHMNDRIIKENISMIIKHLKLNGKIIAIEPTLTGLKYRDKFICYLDRGAFIRSSFDYIKLFEKHFDLYFRRINTSIITKLWSSDFLYLMKKKSNID